MIKDRKDALGIVCSKRKDGRYYCTFTLFKKKGDPLLPSSYTGVIFDVTENRFRGVVNFDENQFVEPR